MTCTVFPSFDFLSSLTALRLLLNLFALFSIINIFCNLSVILEFDLSSISFILLITGFNSFSKGSGRLGNIALSDFSKFSIFREITDSPAFKFSFFLFKLARSSSAAEPTNLNHLVPSLIY